MNEKKRKLIEAGMKLVAKNGFHHTSIQAIADEAGISKGAFYLYFHSKEEFITTAFDFFYQKISDDFARVKKQELDPRTTLEKQINVLSDYIFTYKEVIILFVRENISLGENTDKLIYQSKVENFHWMRESLENIYREKITPVLIDAIIQLEGMMSGYLKWIVLDDVHMEREKFGAFIIRRMDDIIAGMAERGEEPLLTVDHIPASYEMGGPSHDQTLSAQMRRLQEKISEMKLAQQQKNQLLEVVRALENESGKPDKQPLVIQGLLAHFSRHQELQNEAAEIAKHFGVELLQ
ncbi:TetR/AcrR family transcriptional regulator [Lentibacillus sediminis]|uniref:TetR/AcrR family transcriptional regulator n=1 Tax=Lentibacillus sediminis TaxID=1940529 RepID=UPI000C1C2158|nr:TetR/AcrR family transcriptional regulator [Lentibacillus sediminis]